MIATNRQLPEVCATTLVMQLASVQLEDLPTDLTSAESEPTDAIAPKTAPTPPPAPGPAMIFRDRQRLSAAWEAATACLGDNCRVMTMTDMTNILLATNPQHEVWQQTTTVNTGIYIGPTVNNELVAVVGHGVGPLSRQDILLPGSGADHGWVPLPESDWQRLLDGTYGPVAIVPLKSCPPPRSDSVHEPLSQTEATSHPMVRDIFGDRTGELFQRLYDLAAQAAMATDMFSKFEGGPRVNRPLVGLRDLIRSARRQLKEDGRPCGRLLTLSGMQPKSDARPLLEIGYHLDGRPVRLIAAKTTGRITRVHRGPQAIATEYPRLLPGLFTPSPMLAQRPAVWAVRKFDGIWFTCQRRRPDDLTDSDTPEFACKRISPRLKTVPVRVTAKAGETTLATDQRVLAAICRKHQANAYQLRGPIRIVKDDDRSYHVAQLDLYRVAVKTDARFPRWEELATDWCRLLDL